MSRSSELLKLRQSKRSSLRNMYLPMFPEPIDGEISSKEFLKASIRVIKILDYFGKIFMPMKFEMQGHIDKLAKQCSQTKKECPSLQWMLNEERRQMESTVVMESVLCLKRSLHLVQLIFERIVSDFKSKKGSDDLVAIVTKSYEATLEPYQGYTAQQLFWLLSRMMPTRSQVLKSIALGYDVSEEIIIKNMERFSKRLKENITVIRAFYNENHLVSYRR